MVYFTIHMKKYQGNSDSASPPTSPVHFSMNKWKGVFTPQKRASIVEAEIYSSIQNQSCFAVLTI